MSPARKSAKKARPAKRAAAGKRPARRAKAPRAKRTAKPSVAAKPARRGCSALDPFGGPCQSQPRPGSKYCTIHSYLDR